MEPSNKNDIQQSDGWKLFRGCDQRWSSPHHPDSFLLISLYQPDTIIITLIHTSQSQDGIYSSNLWNRSRLAMILTNRMKHSVGTPALTLNLDRLFFLLYSILEPFHNHINKLRLSYWRMKDNLQENTVTSEKANIDQTLDIWLTRQISSSLDTQINPAGAMTNTCLSTCEQ